MKSARTISCRPSQTSASVAFTVEPCMQSSMRYCHIKTEASCVMQAKMTSTLNLQRRDLFRYSFFLFLFIRYPFVLSYLMLFYFPFYSFFYCYFQPLFFLLHLPPFLHPFLYLAGTQFIRIISSQNHITRQMA